MSAMLSAVVLPLLLALPSAEPPGSLEIKLVVASASGPTYPLEVETTSSANRYTLIGGGCAASYVGDDAPPSFSHALILYASKPASGGWQCAAGEPPQLYPGAGRVVAAGIYAQASASQGRVHLDCVVREATSPRGPAPKVHVQLSSADVDNRYVLTSGSCTGEDASQGPYNTVVFSSRPQDDMKGWACEASGPYSATDPQALTMATTVTAHLVACRLQGPGVLESQLFTGPVNSAAGDIGHYPSSQAQVDPGYALTGGGCAVAATQPLPGTGTPAPEYMVRSSPAFLLTSQTPALNDTWECKGADAPGVPSPATAQAFAIGLRVADRAELWVDIPAQGAAVRALPELSGQAEPGSLVTVSEDALILCTATATATGTWSCAPYRPLTSGPHSVLATATDAASSFSQTSAWRAFVVDAVPPATPSLTEPGDGQPMANSTPTLMGTAEPGSTVNVYADGGTAPVCTAVAAADGTWSCGLSVGLADGSHSLTATATDAVGNVSAAASLDSFRVDTQAPDTFITLSPPALALSGDAPFEFSSNEAEVSYECSADEASFTRCPDTYGFAPGVHTLKVRAVDAAGNVDPSPAEYTWTVKLPHLAGGGCSAAPWPVSGLAVLALVVLRKTAPRPLFRNAGPCSLSRARSSLPARPPFRAHP